MTSTISTMEESSSLPMPDNNQYIKFDQVVYHWPRSLSYNTNIKSSDVQALKLHLDTKNWILPDDKDEDEKTKKKVNYLTSRQGGVAKAFTSTTPCQCLFLNKWNPDVARNVQLVGGCVEENDQEEQGIELFIGHYSDMRMNLVFSLKAVRQFAGRLYDLGKTTKVMPLPEAMSNKETSAFKKIERRVIKSQMQLKAVQLSVAKQNKLVTQEVNMSRWGKEYEHIRQVWQGDEHTTFIAFDTESLEGGRKDMLEVGWSIVGPHQPQETFHYIIEEAYSNGLHNGRWVVDNRANFQFGTVLSKPLLGRFPKWLPNGSEVASSVETGNHFMQIIREHRRKGPVYMVFHDSKGDMEVMRELDIDTHDWAYITPGKQPQKSILLKKKHEVEDDTGDVLVSSVMNHQRVKRGADEKLHPVFIIDTQLLFAALRCNGSSEKKSLKNVCIALNVNDGKLGYFHNAANDAHYTAAALVKMAQGPHYIEMRGFAETRLALENDKIKKGAKHTSTKRSSSSWN